MNLLHLSFVGGLKHHSVPPPPTAEERLNAFRAVYPLAQANNYPWKWLEQGAGRADDAARSIGKMRKPKARGRFPDAARPGRIGADLPADAVPSRIAA